MIRVWDKKSLLGLGSKDEILIQGRLSFSALRNNSLAPRLRLTSLTVDDIFGSKENSTVRTLLTRSLKSQHGLYIRVEIVKEVIQMELSVRSDIRKLSITIVLPVP